MNLGEKIKYARNKQNLTQKQLADKLEIAEITVRKYEANKREPNLDSLKRIATMLEVPIAYLTGDVDSPDDRSLTHWVELTGKTDKITGSIRVDTLSMANLAPVFDRFHNGTETDEDKKIINETYKELPKMLENIKISMDEIIAISNIMMDIVNTRLDDESGDSE